MTESSESKRLLIIDDEENMRHMMSIVLGKAGYQTDTASNGKEGLEKLEHESYDYILCDVRMPEMDGMEFLKSAKGKLGSATVIMMSAYGTIDIAVEAMKMGAYDYISKPFKTDEVLLALKKAEERERLKEENLLLKKRIQSVEEQYQFGKMIARSDSMKAIFDLAFKAARHNTTVLIMGESGTGKELIARGIHFNSERAQMPLVAINCGGIPENLLESEFFGYRKGAFTGADKNKKGLFEEADGGTIFLDEIGELPLMLQVKLLRVLQENEIRPIGDSKTQKIDVRVIAATSKNLEEEVKSGRFRQDLFYRLNVLPIILPPLRKRPEDIPILIQYFIDHFKKVQKRNIRGVAPNVMNLLLKYPWPGNVRELENMIERAVVLSEGDILTSECFPTELYRNSASETQPSNTFLLGPGLEDTLFDGYSLKTAQKILEKTLIDRALKATKGNRTQAAKILEISHPSLLSKIKTYNISD